MAQIDDLEIKPITEMSNEEAIEYLRQLRLSRRIPVKKQTKSSTMKAKKAPKKLPKPTKDDAIELLKLIDEV
jgi:hypothetical protein